MLYTKRRQFLQYAASSAIATMGVSHFDIMLRGKRYSQVLGQHTPRKLALLVGINQYSGKINPLEGCVNDVFLQRELLIHRFGFNPKDILTLTDSQATRKGILTAFEEHLIQQAKPGDVVVFHFSGHGSRVSDQPSCDEVALKLSNQCANSTLMPTDARSEGVVRDIMGHTLFLLMSALKTENVTVVLDSCHSGGGKRGNFIIRSYNNLDLASPSPEELEYQRQWLRQLKLSPQEYIERRRKSVAKGIVIASAKREQLAVDASFDNFKAGGFTYLFTQYLWQQTGNESLKRTIVNAGRNTKILAQKQGNEQEPEFESNLSKQNQNPSIYFTGFSSSSADAVVTKVNGDQVELWLGGIDTQSLEAFNKDSIFTALDAQNGERGLVKLESRNGLIGRGKFINTKQTSGKIQLKPGVLLQERIRGIPNDITLKIGLDDTSLDRNTTEQAKQALQNISRIEPLPLGQQEVQYIFGRMTEGKYQELQKKKILNLPAVDSFGLYLPTLDAIIPDSFGDAGEAVSPAITRLKTKFKSLLAARIVKQMLGNTSASRVAVVASMTIATNNKIMAETFPVRGVSKVSNEVNKPTVKIVNSLDSNLPKLPLGTEIAFQVKSYESVPLYISILVIDPSGEMIIIYPNDWSASEGAAKLAPEELLVIPQVDVDEFRLKLGKPLGLVEALIIASTAPLRDSLKALKEIANLRGISKRSPVAVGNDELLNFTNSLLDDFDGETRGKNAVEGVELATEVRGIDAQKLAAMSITFEVVAS